MKIKNKKGFTLIELVVTLVMLSIIGLFLANYFSPILFTYSAVARKVEAQSMSNTILAAISNEVRYATAMKVDEDTIFQESNGITYDYPNGTGTYDDGSPKTSKGEIDGEAFADEWFPNSPFDISIVFRVEDPLLYVTVTMKSIGKQDIVHEETGTIKSPNMVMLE